MAKRYIVGFIMFGTLLGYILGYSHGQYDSYQKKNDDVSLIDIYTK